MADPREYFGMGIAWFDFDEDGWPDLYVANDSGPNFLYRNQKDGTFKEIGVPHGRGGERGRRRAGQHGRGRRRLRQQRALQPLHDELRRGVQAALSQRRRPTSPTSPSARRRRPAACPTWAGARRSSTTTTTGWLDLIAVNGHVYPQLDKSRSGASAGYRQRKLLYHNRGDGTFDEVAARFGPVLTEPRASRGLAVGDLDDDGRLDVVINDLDGSPQVLRNEWAGGGNWLRSS